MLDGIIYYIVLLTGYIRHMKCGRLNYHAMNYKPEKKSEVLEEQEDAK